VATLLLLVQGTKLDPIEELPSPMPLIVSEYDTRTYRLVKLDNDLEAMLIHDADADKVGVVLSKQRVSALCTLFDLSDPSLSLCLSLLPLFVF